MLKLDKCLYTMIAAGALIVSGAYTRAQSTTPAAAPPLPAERGLLGIRMWRPANSVFDMFGAPSKQISYTDSIMSSGGAGGMGGPGSMGSGGYPMMGGSMMTARMPGMSGMSGMPGMSGAAGAGSGGSDLSDPIMVLRILKTIGNSVSTQQASMPGAGRLGGMPGMSPYGGGYGGSPYGGSGGMGGSPYGGSGGMSPYSGASGAPGMMRGGMPGTGMMNPTSSLLGSMTMGSGAGGSGNPDLSEGETRWIYNGSPEKIFTFNKDGRVIEIAIFGKGEGATSRGIHLGDTLKKVYSEYGWADHVVASGDYALLDYRNDAHCAFRFTKTAKTGYKVTGIIVTLVE